MGKKSVVKQRQPEQNSAGLQEDAHGAMAEHVFRLPGEKWSLWKWVAVRAAGFPVSGILKLSAPECGAAAGEVVRAEQEAEQAWLESIETIEDEIKDAEGERRTELIKALMSLKKGNAPKNVSVAPLAAQRLDDFETACAQVDSAWDQYNRAFKNALPQVSKAIREIARSERFREAIVWQNRRALHGSLDALLRMSEEEASRGAERRKREEVIANYWQRYCVKNDTIGFFGPVGWAKIVSQDEPLSVEPGPSLLADRKVYFELWCMDALAEALAKDEAMRPWIAPRRMPFIYVDDHTFYAPQDIRSSLSADELAVLRLCDANLTAREIAQELIASPTALTSEDSVYERLALLRDEGLISWDLHIPYSPRSEITLRHRLERIGDEQLREKAIGALDEMERAREEVASAAGDAERLDEAIGEMEATFTRLTGSASTRNEGRAYAGRTLIYEDCRRDIEIEIGPRILEDLAPTLSMLLASARWLTSKIGNDYRKAFGELHRQMAKQSGSPIVSAMDVWSRIQVPEFSDVGPLVEPHLNTLRQRWLDILSFSPEQRRVSYSSEQIRPRVVEAFDAARPGWQEAFNHSPDLMIAATSVDAIHRGDYKIVLGEIHVARNTLSYSVFVQQHPRPDELFKAVDLDMPRARIFPVPPRYMTGLTSRVYRELVSPRDYRLEFSRDATDADDGRSLSIAELVIEEVGGELIVRTRDGRLQLDIIDAFGDVLTAQVINSFRVLTPGNHTPRISIDRVVIHRETWRFSPSEMEFAFEKDEAYRFLEAHRFAGANDLPRFIFVKSPAEIKPMFVDLDSPVLVNLFTKMIRQASEKALPGELITVSEMLPRPDQAWLPDAEGNLYTSELRLVAVDLIA
jgi:hypothetical protein